MTDNLVQNPSVQKALNEVYENTNSINWAIFIYSDIRAQKSIKLMASGTGGVSEAHSFLTNDDVYYCYLRVDLQDGASTSAKFVFLTYIGDKVSPLKRARVSVHKGIFAKSLPVYAVEMQPTSLEEAKPDSVQAKVTNSGSYGGWNIQAKPSTRSMPMYGRTIRRKINPLELALENPELSEKEKSDLKAKKDVAEAKAKAELDERRKKIENDRIKRQESKSALKKFEDEKRRAEESERKKVEDEKRKIEEGERKKNKKKLLKRKQKKRD